MAVAIRKWSGDTPSQGEFDVGAQSSETYSHNRPGEEKEKEVFAFSSPNPKFSTNSLPLSTTDMQ
jgi:hypothetical protein